MSLRVAVTRDLAACHALRRAVFIEEQGITEAEEWDDLDGGAKHLLIREDGQPVATARLVVQGESGRIGRICVLKPWRGRGLGAALVRCAIGHFRKAPGVTKAVLSAQEYALPFYEALGFIAFGPAYDDAGIAHRDMELAL